ncbi:MAG: 50S ribosomal protein L25 [Actinomycetota bacterium]|nr:50S ribosomal protein L25 [Actinomycetota bacterium]MDA3013311.1 50S ribosomal protein L25 [Actinomycetota bacterium]
METILKATIRDNKGSAESRRLRIQGDIPAIVYGLGMEPLTVSLNARDFSNAMKTEAGSNIILNLEVGNQKFTTLAREIQKHPFRNEFLHVDLIQIDLTKTVSADVNIHYVGTPIGVKEDGGLIQTINSTISITALPTNIPSALDLDISGLNVGENATAKDVVLPEGVLLSNEDDESVLVTITLPRAAVEEETDEALLDGEESTEDSDGEESSTESDGEEPSDDSGE